MDSSPGAEALFPWRRKALTWNMNPPSQSLSRGSSPNLGFYHTSSSTQAPLPSLAAIEGPQRSGPCPSPASLLTALPLHPGHSHHRDLPSEPPFHCKLCLHPNFLGQQLFLSDSVWELAPLGSPSFVGQEHFSSAPRKRQTYMYCSPDTWHCPWAHLTDLLLVTLWTAWQQGQVSAV